MFSSGQLEETYLSGIMRVGKKLRLQHSDHLKILYSTITKLFTVAKLSWQELHSKFELWKDHMHHFCSHQTFV